MTTEETKKADHTTTETEKAHDHDHENCTDPNHDHADADDINENGQKATKGEKKFKKAIARMGMKPVDGIDYVTLKTQKDVNSGLILVHYVH